MFKHNGTKNMQPFIHNVSKNIFLSMKGSFVSFIPNHPENSKWDKSEFFVLPAHRFPSEQFFFYKTSHYQTCAKQTIDHKKYMMGHQSRRWLQVSVLFLHKKTAVGQNNASCHKIINGQDAVFTCFPSKEGNSWWSICLPNHFCRKNRSGRTVMASNVIVKGTDTERVTIFQVPNQFVIIVVNRGGFP